MLRKENTFLSYLCNSHKQHASQNIQKTNPTNTYNMTYNKTFKCSFVFGAHVEKDMQEEGNCRFFGSLQEVLWLLLVLHNTPEAHC